DGEGRRGDGEEGAVAERPGTAAVRAALVRGRRAGGGGRALGGEPALRGPRPGRRDVRGRLVPVVPGRLVRLRRRLRRGRRRRGGGRALCGGPRGRRRVAEAGEQRQRGPGDAAQRLGQLGRGGERLAADAEAAAHDRVDRLGDPGLDLPRRVGDPVGRGRGGQGGVALVAGPVRGQRRVQHPAEAADVVARGVV